MTLQNSESGHSHGPENAEHEIRKAYNCVIETGVSYFSNQNKIPGVNPDEVVDIYKHAFQCYRKGQKLAAERWARTAKHLARAFWHEAKITYLEPKTTDLPFLEGAKAEEYQLREHSDTTEDLINSVAEHVPPGLNEMPDSMKKYLARARLHLETLESPDYKHELLRAERIKASHEYGRVLECMALAYEADHSVKRAA